MRRLRPCLFFAGGMLTASVLLLPLPHASVDWYSPRKSMLSRLMGDDAGMILYTNDSSFAKTGPECANLELSFSAPVAAPIREEAKESERTAKEPEEIAKDGASRRLAVAHVVVKRRRRYWLSRQGGKIRNWQQTRSERVKFADGSGLTLPIAKRTWNQSAQRLEQRGPRRPYKGAPRKSSHVQIFGLYTSGTNSLQFDLSHGLENTSVCPDTVVHFEATHERTCHGPRMGKHNAPQFIKKFLASEPAGRFNLKTVFILRDPFSWLKSILRNKQYLMPCRREGHWLNHTCSCHGLTRRRPADKVCQLDGPRGDLAYRNIVGMWKHYARGYMRIIKADRARNPSEHERRVALVSYRDLVVEPQCTLSNIAHQLRLKRNNKDAEQLQEHEAKNDAAHANRGSAVTDLLTRSYMSYFQTWEVAAVCKQLLPRFPKELMGLLTDCHSHF
mmetsp:Transcript_8059/g.18846  ORF Transcript_8059/g.18846 Transcript_8059/m.18846 type:complete len:445 (-) Transcript_8059:227-1561(-)